jgi:hypothetical protein
MAGLKISHTLAGHVMVVLALSSPAKAADFSFSGNLSVDNPAQFFSFTTSKTSYVGLQSFFYSGGIQANGAVVLAGGIDPIVWVFDASTNPNTFIFQLNGHGPGPGMPVSNFRGDGIFSPGNYTVALSQYYTSYYLNPVFSTSLSVSNPFPYVPGLNGQTDKWALDIFNVDVATLISPQAVTGPKAVPVSLSNL